jgi:toxin-antitoxin system PIN domain toxin
VLLYAVNEDAPQHDVACAWLAAAFDAPAGVALAWGALVGFIRISTRRGILPQPLAIRDALLSVRDWVEAPRARILHPTERHGPLLASLLLAVGTAGNLTNDAHLAALAMEHGATLVSFDRDFDRFEGLSFERLRA